MIDQNIIAFGALILFVTILVIAAKGGFDKLIHSLNRNSENYPIGIKIINRTTAQDFTTQEKSYEVFGESLEQSFNTVVALKEYEKQNDKKK